ncbi:MAG: ribonuclease HI [Gammaproteobacteria bacterium]|nr:ribonuclease HI [Gammaproteobacteria bacterium]
MKYTIYTDGACINNPGPGGWAALIRTEEGEKVIQGGAPETTNNRMEMMAVIEALKGLDANAEVQLFSDSKYVVNGITQWLPNWKKNRWQTSSGSSVKNHDLWRQLDSQNSRLQVRWNWVKAHSGHPENELVDQKAQEYAQRLKVSRSND